MGKAAPDPAKPLHNTRWERFAQARAYGCKQKEAYTKAGFTAKNLSHQCSVLERRPEVKARITFLLNKQEEDLARAAVEVSVDSTVAHLERLAINAEEACQYETAMKIRMNQLKIKGLYNERRTFQSESTINNCFYFPDQIEDPHEWSVHAQGDAARRQIPLRPVTTINGKAEHDN